jgi:hypothetical protein
MPRLVAKWARSTSKPTVHNVEELLGIVKRVAAFRKVEGAQKLEAERLRKAQIKPPPKA